MDLFQYAETNDAPPELHFTRRLPKVPSPTIQERFEIFHKNHPEIYAELVRFARMVKAKGFERYSIEACFQRVRWYFQFERDEGATYKLNDHFRSRYARLIMSQEPDLDGFFELRSLRAE